MAGASRANCATAGLRPWHWGLVLAVVLALKQGYGLAGTEHLQWMLAPLAGVSNLVGGLSFRLQPDGVWLDAEHRVVLVKACAGGNFLLTAWLACLWRWRRRASPLTTVLAAALAAWVVALAANGLRILLAIHTQDALARLGGLTPAESHRLVGIGVYFLSLWILLSGPRRLYGAPIVATGLYLGVNLALPALRALLLGLPPLDLAHVLWTSAIPAAAIVLALSARWLVARCGGPIGRRFRAADSRPRKIAGNPRSGVPTDPSGVGVCGRDLGSETRSGKKG